MSPLLAVFGLDIALLALAYWTGSLFGLVLVIGLCFVVALGLAVFSTATQTPQAFKDSMPSSLGPFFSSFAALDR